MISNLLSLFFPRATRTRLITRRSMDIRLEDWRNSENLVSDAAKISEMPAFVAMMDVLRTESPSNYAIPQLGLTDTDVARHFGQIEGYQFALNNLESLSKFAAPEIPLESTFEDPNKDPSQPVEE